MSTFAHGGTRAGDAAVSCFGNGDCRCIGILTASHCGRHSIDVTYSFESATFKAGGGFFESYNCVFLHCDAAAGVLCSGWRVRAGLYPEQRMHHQTQLHALMAPLPGAIHYKARSPGGIAVIAVIFARHRGRESESAGIGLETVPRITSLHWLPTVDNVGWCGHILCLFSTPLQRLCLLQGQSTSFSICAASRCRSPSLWQLGANVSRRTIIFFRRMYCINRRGATVLQMFAPACI